MNHHKSENLSGGLLADVCAVIEDRLCAKYGQHWPIVVSRKGLAKESDALWLKRVLRSAMGHRRTRTHALNRVLDCAQALGIDVDLRSLLANL